MRAPALLLSLCLTLGLPSSQLAAQTAQGGRMVKVDIIRKSDIGRHLHAKAAKIAKAEKSDKGVKVEVDIDEDPKEVHIRMPLSLVKALLVSAGESEIKINGHDKQGMKTDELVKFLESAKAGDTLVEVTTDKGDLVRVFVE